MTNMMFFTQTYAKLSEIYVKLVSLVPVLLCSHLQEYPVNIGPVREYPVVKVIKNKFINLNNACFSFVGWAKRVNFDIGECQSPLYINARTYTQVS